MKPEVGSDAESCKAYFIIFTEDGDWLFISSTTRNTILEAIPRTVPEKKVWNFDPGLSTGAFPGQSS